MSTATPQPETTTPIGTNYPMVLVRWADAHAGEGGWLSLDEYEDDGECIVETVGFLVPPAEGGKENHINLWQSYNDGEAIHPFHIPAAMVRDIKLLNLDTPPGNS